MENSLGGRFDAFYTLDEEKRKKIVDAALSEFAEKGFRRASTNAIAAAAKIGKGMLFYYFGSKEALFDFLCEYTLAFARDRYLRRCIFEEGDFLLRYQKLTEVKREAMAEYPKVMAFYESFYREDGAEHFEKYQREIDALSREVIGGIYRDIDYSLFREDMDGGAAVRYIRWLFDAYQAEIAVRFRRGEIATADRAVMVKEWRRFQDFSEDLRRLFYKADPH